MIMNTEQQELLDDLLNVDSGLSAREIEFIEDLDKNWRDRDLTNKQWEWMEKIAQRVGA